MHRQVVIKSTAGLLGVLATICTILGPQPADAQGRQGRGGGEAARASALPMFFDVNFVRPASQTGQTKVVC